MTVTATPTCARCGMQWEWTWSKRNTKPAKTCPSCRPLSNAPKRAPHLELASRVVAYRLAIEMATALLETDRPAMALAVLYDVEAPARAGLSCRRGCGFLAPSQNGRENHERSCAA